MYKEQADLVTPGDNVTIWRYMDFTKFVSLLDKQALFFVRADKFGDPFEGSYPKASIERRNKELIEKGFNSLIEFFSNRSKQLREYAVINCWHKNKYESAAMWKLYLKSNEGIAIKSTVRRLKTCIKNTVHHVNIASVNYIDFDKDWPDQILDLPTELLRIHQFLCKRRSFEHERELRAIVYSNPLPNLRFTKDQELETQDLNFRPSPFEDGLYIPVDLEMLIYEIYVAPSSPKWLHELVESVTRKYGLKKKVCQSTLDEKPVY
jgi:hypothetical protein